MGGLRSKSSSLVILVGMVMGCLVGIRLRWIAVVSTGFVLLIFLRSIWVVEVKDSYFVVAFRWSWARWLGPEPVKCVDLLSPWVSPVWGPFLVASLSWCSWWFGPFLPLIRAEMVISSLYSAMVQQWRDDAFVSRTELALGWEVVFCHLSISSCEGVLAASFNKSPSCSWCVRWSHKSLVTSSSLLEAI